MRNGRWRGPTPVPGPSRWIGGLLCGVVACGWFWAALLFAAPVDEVIPIGSITVNPMANNRCAVILQGKTKTVTTYNGLDSFGRSICGQGFILEDDTGSLDVLFLIRCQANDPPALLGEGERVVVHATIDVSSDNVKNMEGKELLFKAMATKIVRGK